MEKLKSEGKCVYCEKTYSQSGMSRHLSTHLKKEEAKIASKKTAFHLKVSAGEMFIQLLVNGTSTLQALDDFLRGIWLECCGHMSSFKIKSKEYAFEWDATEFGEKKSKKMSSIFKKNMVLVYDYDFGSTTSFQIKVMNEYQIPLKKSIVLLSRNEPLEILCHVCQKKAATDICSVCMYQGPSFFCTSCAKKHTKTCDDFDDYAGMSVVNSPRMGTCAYDGGTIDVERDGIYKG